MKRTAIAALALTFFAYGSARADQLDPVTGSIYRSVDRYDDAKAKRAPRPRLHRPLTTPQESIKEPIPEGPLEIVVSIATQKVTLFADGVAIGTAPVSTGVPGHPTPMGIFSVISKDRYHHSNLYSNAPMPYMQRLTWSGVAMHQGPLPGFPASHGCIRLPESFALRLWHLTKVGARVIVTRNPVAPKAISHPRLFEPRKPVDKPAEAQASAAPLRQIKMADALGTTVVRDGVISNGPPAAEVAPMVLALDKATAVVPAAAAQATPKLKGPVHVFISRRDSKLYVRQGVTPVFDQPITIADQEHPIGTHLYTAMALSDDGKAMSWNVITIPSSYPRETKAPQGKKGREQAKGEKPAEALAGSTAEQALDRIGIPDGAVQRISELLAPGSSLIISDNRLSDETGSDTEFIVTTR